VSSKQQGGWRSQDNHQGQEAAKGKKWLIFLLRVAVNQATISIVVVNIATTIKATNATATIANPTIIIETINATIDLDAITRTLRAQSPTTRR
jgi:hypothetical protein